MTCPLIAAVNYAVRTEPLTDGLVWFSRARSDSEYFTFL